MKTESDVTKMVEEIAMQAKENQEEFIFETIRPYCENILQIKINKEELKQILLNGMQKQQPCEGMRDATEEERESTKDYIDSISKPTGLQFDDIYEELDFVQPHKKISVNLQPCGDCISREELLKLLDSKTVDTNPDHFNFKDKKDYERWVLHNGYNTGLVQARIYVGELPPVTPSYNSIKTELDHVIDEIIIRIEQTRDKDKLCEYPYNRCINIIKEEIKNVN